MADTNTVDVWSAVPFFSQAATFDKLWPVIQKNVESVIDNGKYSHGAQVAQLEQRLTEYTGARHVVGVNSGTDALLLLLWAAGIEPEDGVLVPAFSFVATASAVALAGGRPQFTDIEPTSYAMAPDSAEERVRANTRFVLPAHLFSRMADMAAIRAVATRAGMVVLEDSAEAIGMRQSGVHAGLHGAGGVLSFFPSKTLGALGDAGAVLTDDDRIAQRVAALRHHGRAAPTIDYFPGIASQSEFAGVNSKMDDIQAAVLLAKLSCLDDDIRRREELAAGYRERLAGLPGLLRLPGTVAEGDGDRGVYYVYLIEVERRDDLVSYLRRRGIGTEIYYPTPLHLQPCFAELGYRRGDFPNAEAACEHAVALPLYPDLSMARLARICEAVARFYTGVGI